MMNLLLYKKMFFATLCVAVSPAIYGALTVPGADGSDGTLTITENTTIDLSQAVPATWDTDNTANAGNGVYDADQWAVVFKYSSVTIDAGTTLSFSNHTPNAPIVWLINGDCTIDGTINLNGQGWLTGPGIPRGGPGGFRGGSGDYIPNEGVASGFGPGGGGIRQGGSFGTVGNSGRAGYGNPSLVPLIGGSGGGGGWGDNIVGRSGGGGGGAILIACSGILTINGQIRSNGGSGSNDATFRDGNRSGGGSGGGIRLIADELAGTGNVQALGGGGTWAGGFGRIRIERVTNANSLTLNPAASVVGLTDGDTALIWPPAEAPMVEVLSIGGVDVPTDPNASFGTLEADVLLGETSTAQVVVQTTGVEEASQVFVRVGPQYRSNLSEVTATVDQIVTPDPLVINWVADVPVISGHSAVQVRVVRP